MLRCYFIENLKKSLKEFWNKYEIVPEKKLEVMSKDISGGDPKKQEQIIFRRNSLKKMN